MIDKDLLKNISVITDEEKRILNGTGINKNAYTKTKPFIVDSAELIDSGKLIDIRLHTRFTHFPRHSHNYIEMIYMCSGSTTHIINNEKIVLREGEVLILGLGTKHEILPAEKDDIAVNFIILPDFFISTLSFPTEKSDIGDLVLKNITNKTSDYLKYNISDNLTLCNLIENMIWNFVNPKLCDKRLSEETLRLFFLYMMKYTVKDHVDKKDYDKELLIKALRYIDVNFKDASLTELSNSLNQSIVIMSRLIKELTGKTYKELLQTKRLDKAAYMLTSTKLAISTISSEVGYDNRSYFYKIFKEQFGLTPKAYRIKHAN